MKMESSMPLDTRMSQLRELLSSHEKAPPTGLARFLPPRDGHSGKCFEDALEIVLASDITSGLLLVHGLCRGPGGVGAHAWVEVPGGLVYDAVLGRVYHWATYSAKLEAIPHRRYTVREVIGFDKTTDIAGPWTPEEEEKAREFVAKM
jgi:hypothetical protein